MIHIGQKNIDIISGSVRETPRRLVEIVVRDADKLPKRDKVLLLMRIRDGYAYSDISAVFGITASSVSRKIKKLVDRIIKDHLVNKLSRTVNELDLTACWNGEEE